MITSKSHLEDAVAVVGMAGRFPGAETVEQLWRNLLDRVETIRVFTRDELRAAGVAEALIDDPDYVPAKGIIEGIEYFDERFFDYSAREAQLMDPQQRLFLECAWHALEQAGFDPSRHGGATGVFASAGMSTYLLELAADPGLREHVGIYDLFLHNAPDYLATRVSYKAGLTGPSFTVQTGCSSSLVAIHLACQSLLAGECDLALAGGVTARAPQRRGYLYDAGSALSPDGRCRPFDARANGTVPSEAIGVVALKRVEDAIRDRNRMHALVAGSAINNDGNRKIGYTAPSVEGQCNAISEALEVAGVSPRAVGYVEAHGTATRLGDPLEVAALSRAFAAGTADRQYCALGAIKANIGHTDAAAGVAGFIKAVMAIEHGVIPATLHYHAPNPEIDFPGSPFFVNGEAIRWSAGEHGRCAGVSAFGVGGTNAHAILRQAPERTRAATVQVPGKPQLIVLSARTEAALDRVTEALCAQLEAAPPNAEAAGAAEFAGAAEAAAAATFADLAFTSQDGRRAFEHRRAVVASGADQAVAAIRARDPVAVRTGKDTSRATAFVFPGGGTQYPNMGRGLYESEPVFRRHIDECCEIARAQVGLDLRTLMYPSGADVERADQTLRQVTYGVPAIWMTDYALAQLWMSWGVTPSSMIGHSLGEYVAACISGVLSVRDALTLATFRALLCERSARGAHEERGASLSVSLGEAELRALLPAAVEIGVVNTPSSCVAAGPARAIAELEQVLAAREVSCKRLHIGAAVHSVFMEPLMDEVRQFASKMVIGPPSIPYYSNLEGRLIAPADLTPDYWAKHLRYTARFSDNVAGLVQQRGLTVLEVGPGTSLASAVSAQVTPDMDVVVLSAMRQVRDPRDDREVLAQCVAGAWSHGVTIDWRAVQGDDEGDDERRLAAFPVYAFERTRHWIEPAPAPAVAHARTSGNGDGRAAELPAEHAAEHATARAADGTAKHVTDRAAAPATDRTAVSATAVAGVQLPPGYRGDELATAVAEVWRDQLGVSALTAESNFFALGGTSLMAVRLLSKLQRRLQPDRRLLPEELLRTASFGPFVDHVRSTCVVGAGQLGHRDRSERNGAVAPGDPDSSLVLLRPGSSTAHPPLFIVHPAGGHVFHYRLLAEALDPRVTVVGFKAPGLDGDRPMLQTIEGLAEHHLRSMRAAGHTAGPYYLAGSSLGGCVAYEMAQRLQSIGAQVALLAMIDTPAPDDLPSFADHADYVGYLFGDMWGATVSLDELRALPEPERIPHALRQLAAAGSELGFEAEAAERILAMFVTNERAMRSYRPRPHRGPVVYFRARERRRHDPSQPELGWAQHVGGELRVEVVPGNHVTMHELPHVTELAARLNAHLTRAQDSLPHDGAAA